MYGYEYEEDVLRMLRLLKFLHMQDPKVIQSLVNLFENYDLDCLYEIAEMAIWELFSEVEFGTEEEDEDMSIVSLGDSEVNKFLQLNAALSWRGGFYSTAAAQKKLQDMFAFYGIGLSHSVYHIKYHFFQNAAMIQLWLSPDCYDSIDFGNSLLDFLLYIRQENKVLEDLLEEKDKTAAVEQAAVFSEEAA